MTRNEIPLYGSGQTNGLQANEYVILLQIIIVNLIALPYIPNACGLFKMLRFAAI